MAKYDFSGKVSLITGGASGIGKAITEAFAANGSDIALIDINQEAGSRIVKALIKEFKVKAQFYNCDISNYEEVKKTCKSIIEMFGKVDNLICAAGYGSKVSIETMDISEWKKAVDINLNGTFFIIHCLINQMLNQKKGNIIIIGSATVVTGSGGGVHYAASKTAQYGIVKGLSYELLTRGIRANIITPHIIDTPMLRKRYPDSPEINAKLAARVPIGRIGEPSDISNIALFLASDESEYVCGAEILADGGALHYLNPLVK
ncbi:MAG: SDR family oxidoreductase [Actinobacteria bacterium]|nr:SDR family oxidoreductase [Actinomycetota bacterium]